jgi:hypothetical protein
MSGLRKNRFTLASIGLSVGVAMGASSLQGCGEDGLCGPCGSIATGQLSISGNTQLDGFFTAVADLQGASASIRAQFEADVRALAEIYGMAEGEINADFVAELIGEIRADINEHASGGFRLQYVGPRCSADVNIAVEAQASCEANAECDVEVDPGMASVVCEGKCEGSCSAMCEGNVSCTPPGGAIGCDVGCEGTCELDAAAACEGTCRGSCDGECSLENAEGECEGQCDGMCTGSCEASAMAECNGTCHGTCHASVTPPSCEGSITCEGTCMGECSGGCAGDFEPPSASADCEASAECNAQASAQAEANVTCTPPSIEFGFEFDAGLDASARAEFTGRLQVLRVRLAAIMQGVARVQALFNGEVNGEVVFDPSPFASLTAEVGVLVEAGISGEIEIPPGRINCVIPAFEEAADALVSVGADLRFTAEASAMFGAFIGNPTG